MNSSASVCLVCFPFSSFAKLSVLPILQHHLLTTFIFTLTISSSMYQSIHFPDELTSPLLTPSVYFPLLHLYTNSFIFQPLSLIHLISITLLPSLELLPNSLPTSITSTNETPYPPFTYSPYLHNPPSFFRAPAKFLTNIHHIYKRNPLPPFHLFTLSP